MRLAGKLGVFAESLEVIVLLHYKLPPKWHRVARADGWLPLYTESRASQRWAINTGYWSEKVFLDGKWMPSNVEKVK